jgi:hypothetical protein
LDFRVRTGGGYSHEQGFRFSQAIVLQRTHFQFSAKTCKIQQNQRNAKSKKQESNLIRFRNRAQIWNQHVKLHISKLFPGVFVSGQKHRTQSAALAASSLLN